MHRELRLLTRDMYEYRKALETRYMSAHPPDTLILPRQWSVPLKLMCSIDGLQVGVANDVIPLLEGKRTSSQVHKYIAATVKDSLRCQSILVIHVL